MRSQILKSAKLETSAENDSQNTSSGLVQAVALPTNGSDCCDRGAEDHMASGELVDRKEFLESFLRAALIFSVTVGRMITCARTVIQQGV